MTTSGKAAAAQGLPTLVHRRRTRTRHAGTLAPSPNRRRTTPHILARRALGAIPPTYVQVVAQPPGLRTLFVVASGDFDSLGPEDSAFDRPRIE